jgi:hypothetical protein
MPSHAKRRARAEAAAADVVDDEEALEESSSDDEEDHGAAVRPAKRLKGNAAAEPATGGQTGKSEQAAPGSSGRAPKEKPLVLCSRGIPGRCVSLTRSYARAIHLQKLCCQRPGAGSPPACSIPCRWPAVVVSDESLATFHSCVSNERPSTAVLIAQ